MGSKSSKSSVQEKTVVVDSLPGPPLVKLPGVQRRDETSNTNANIAAIDFGSTYCSLAYKTEDDTGETVVRLDGTNRRVPNAMLLKIEHKEQACVVCKSTECSNERLCIEEHGSAAKNREIRILKHYHCKIKDFGFVAQKTYQTVRKKQYDSYIYFERVKVTLMETTVRHACIPSQQINTTVIFCNRIYID